MSKSIEINYLGDSGYEALYPNTMLNSVLDWQENLYSKDEILDSATKALYGLGTDVVPNDVLAILSNAALVGETSLTDVDGNAVGVQIATGSYAGTGTEGDNNPNQLTLGLNCNLLLITPSNIKVGGSATTDLLLANSVGGISFSSSQTYDIGGSPIRVSVSGNTISYYGVDKYSQMNQSGVNYTYVAIGKAVTT